jgi:hypothetical protein
VWLRVCGCTKASNATETQSRATETHDGDTARSCRAGALCHGAHSACVLAVACACGPSRAWRRVSQKKSTRLMRVGGEGKS